MAAAFALLVASLSLSQCMALGIDLILVRYRAKLLCDTEYVRYRRSKSLSHLWVRAKPAKSSYLVCLCDIL